MLSLICAFLFTGCLSENVSNEVASVTHQRNVIDNKFVPINGQTLLFVGQDIDTINEYVEETQLQPAAVTAYISVNETGVYRRTNHPNGPLDLQSYIAGYPNSVISVGLSMIEAYDRIVAGDKGLRKSLDKIIEELKSTHRPVFLRIGYEADGYWNNYQPETYKKMWQYVVDRIAALNAENIATVWQLATHCGMTEENRGLGNTLRGYDYDQWWPEDSTTVDWVGFSYFSQMLDCPGNTLSGGLPEGFGSLGDMDENGASLALENVVNYLKTKGKPLFIAEATPKRFDINKLTYKMSYDTTIDDRFESNPQEIWDGWFKPFFSFVKRHQDVIKAIAYINMPWNNYQGWSCIPERGTKEGNCSQGYWGDARVHKNAEILKKWKATINEPVFLSSSQNDLFAKLIGWDQINFDVPKISQKPYTRYHIPHAIPGVIQAEHFDIGGPGFAYLDKNSVNKGREFDTQCRPNEQVDTGALAEGNCAIGWISAGEWLEYTINTKNTFTGSIFLSVASPLPGGHIQFSLNGEESGDIIIPNTGAWDKFKEIELKGVKFEKGQQVLRLSVVAAGAQSASIGNIDFIRVHNPNNIVSIRQPFSGQPLAIPGKIEAEYYDQGGEGVSYHDLSPGDSGDKFSIPCARGDDVDIGKGNVVECAVGWTLAGEWMDYTVLIVEDGFYDITINGASQGVGGDFQLLLDDNVIADFSIPKTSSWLSYKKETIEKIPLKSGKRSLRVFFTKNGNSGATPGNLDYIEFTKHNAEATEKKSVTKKDLSKQRAYQGQVAVIPGLLKAGLYDEGGQGVSYFDNTEGNTAHTEWSSTCRIKDDVDVASYGTDCVLSYTQEGEWVEYTVDIMEEGLYKLKTTVYSGGDGGLFQLQLGGRGITPPIRIDSTGDWGAAGVITTNGVELPKGRHILRLFLIENGEVGSVGNIASIEFIKET